MKSYTPEEFLSRTGRNKKMIGLAMIVVAAPLIYTPASAQPQTSISQIKVAGEYCELAKKLNFPPLSVELDYSNLSPEERRILEEHRSFAGLGQFTSKELEEKCIEQFGNPEK